MARGKAAKVGDSYVSANGYKYIRTEKEWKLAHHIIAEENLGRALNADERVRFKDGDRSNLTSDNIMVVERGRGSLRRRKAQLEARIDELKAELQDVNKQLGL